MIRGQDRPTLYIVAGSNGAGKSTLTRHLRQPLPVIDPDQIMTKECLSPVAAGREALVRFGELVKSKASFVYETTLSGRGLIRKVREAKEKGYHISLRYVCLGSPDLAIQRVALRVRMGGHDVPETDIRRRYARSLTNLPFFLAEVDHARLYDNSGNGHVIVADLEGQEVVWHVSDETRPSWAVSAIEVWKRLIADKE